MTSPPYYNLRDYGVAGQIGMEGTPEGGTVLDPFAGSGTTGVVAKHLRRHFVGVEINPDYWKMATDRIEATMQEFQQLENAERATE